MWKYRQHRLARFLSTLLMMAFVGSAADSAWGRTQGQTRALDTRTRFDFAEGELPFVATTPMAPLVTVGHADVLSLIGDISLLEQGLFDDAADGRWDDHSLLTASLIAGGIDSTERLAKYERQAEHLHRAIQRLDGARGDEVTRARTVLEYLHANVFTGGYELECSSVARALDSGRFNCVTASILFNELATRAGLVVRGLETPGHAMSRLYVGETIIDVETTYAAWFRILDDPRRMLASIRAVTDHFGSEDPITGARGSQALTVTAEQSPLADRREVTPVELVAMIYYNRGVDLLTREQFAEAAAANAKALLLDPKSDTAWGNLMATINNWAIALGTQDRFAEAIDLLDRGVAMDPGYPTFRPNHLHIYHRWAQSLARQGRYDEALRVLDRARQAMPTEDKIPRIREEVLRERTLALPDDRLGVHSHPLLNHPAHAPTSLRPRTVGLRAPSLLAMLCIAGGSPRSPYSV